MGWRLKFIYHCYGGSHSSVTAAAIHLGILPATRVATGDELLCVPYYDAQVAPDHGRIRFMGFDEGANPVYIASKRNLGPHYEKIMRAFLRPVNGQQEDIVFINTMPYVNIWMVLGGFMSRRLGFNRVGRAIIIYGTRLSYFRFRCLVQGIKCRYITGGNLGDQDENYCS